MDGLKDKKTAHKLAVYAAMTSSENIHQNATKTRPAIDLGTAVYPENIYKNYCRNCRYVVTILLLFVCVSNELSLSLSAFPFSLRGIFYVYGCFSTPAF